MIRARVMVAAAVVATAGVTAGAAACSDGAARTPGGTPVRAEASAAPSGEPVRVVVPGRPGESAAVADSGRVAAPATPAHNSLDATFVQMMIPHHEQALRMTALAPGRAADARVKAVAERIRVGQSAEVPQLRAWLAARGLPAAPPGHDHATMPGVQTAGDLNALAAARGADFDRRFVAMMTAHHRGALRMVDDVLSGGSDTVVAELANEIGVEQAAEIRRMSGLV
jgi:uncharacterized protein (DUF305 family)